MDSILDTVLIGLLCFIVGMATSWCIGFALIRQDIRKAKHKAMQKRSAAGAYVPTSHYGAEKDLGGRG